MIVKNEENNILECLNSVKDVIDFVSILDTGSMDRTREIIRTWGENIGIPTIVHETIFTNFGDMRTQSFKLAKESFPSDYILVMDARQLFKGNIDKDKMDLDCYDIIQEFITLKYANLRILKTSLNWICKGVVHEYWDVPMGSTRGTITTAILKDNGKGGNRGNKLQNYKKLLLEGIEGEIDPFLIQRYTFYLANTYLDLNEYDDAIETYKKRIEMDGWYEEIWYCYYRIGMAYEAKGDLNMAILYYLEAHEIDSKRTEHLYRLSLLYRKQQKFNLAMLYLIIAKLIPYEKRLLFVENDVYEYLIDFEISISGYYVNKIMGKTAQEKLMKMKLPEIYASIVKENEKWYK